MTQQFNVNHGHPDGDLMTSILAYEWFWSVGGTTILNMWIGRLL